MRIPIKRGYQTYCLLEQHSRCTLKSICDCICHTQKRPMRDLNPKGTTMQCPDCGNTFKNQRGLRIHQGRHHKDTYRVQIVSAHARALEMLIAEIERVAETQGITFEDAAGAAAQALRASCP